MDNISNVVSTIDEKDGPVISMVGDTYRIVISGKQTSGAYAVIDMLIPPGGGPGPHAHAEIQESFYVVNGEVEVKSEDGTYTATKGSFVNIPFGGLVHCFKNKTNDVAHLICTVMPAGMEDMFLELGKPVTPGTFLPLPELNPALIEQMKTVAEQYGQKLFPPDYFDKPHIEFQ